MKKVLIAEDDAGQRMLMYEYLQKYRDQFDVLFANDGLEAMEMLRREPISLLVTDLKMPRVEGLVLLAYVSRNFPELPCIAMTSLRIPHLKRKLQQDVLYYLEKPFGQDRFCEAIVSALNRETLEASVEGISVGSFLQLIGMELKTCICEILLPDDDKGFFYFKDGDLYDASFRDLTGEAAAQGMIRAERAVINIRTLPVTEIERRIQRDLTGIILDALKGEA